MEILKPLLNDRFVIMFMLRVMLNKRYCHITGKYRGSGHRDCNINVKS